MPSTCFKFCLVILVLSAVLSCKPSEQSSHLETVKNQGVLRVGTNYGLTTYYNDATGPAGFEYELAAGFADYLGVRLEVFPYYTLNELFPQLEDAHLDIIAAGISVTPERKTKFRFGPAYQNVSQKLVFKQGNTRPRTIEDVESGLLVISGSSHAETLRDYQAQFNNLRWTETDEKDAEELLEMVLAEELDYAVADSNILALIRRRHPELSIGFSLNQEQGIAWVLNKETDDSLLAALIEYFGTVQEDGRLAALEDKYFGHVRQFNYVDTREFIKSAQDTLPAYQHWFQAYADDVDWRLLAAMSYQESHWDPLARSPTGVRGMMMLTLATAKDVGIKSRLDPEQSIRGGAKYFSSLLRRIPARITEPDRIWFALAAYNIGLGHLEDARIITQKQGGNPDLWVDVKKRLPLLRQKKFYKNTRYGYARGNEAVTYVANIRRYYDTLVWLDEQRPELLEASTESDESLEKPTDSASSNDAK
ncbi:membrane-bound lytic murein transglycosylase MltF [Aestuariibacter sp. AA17]|uniref:Membrane-bound lytic murein transglycosylase F n=1 Tax=Fluctibacter corallii TaxID=2984329 RepID=A0ABT3AA33_9ALTE|nr:membrane-bound lytic murein transglycosylase MltF [Aestuariibacter sp. AA17]MCV2885533.1 membrane-bound lytic murein transglycosylase MltF [Aestuariibacter sp. AA17]